MSKKKSNKKELLEIVKILLEILLVIVTILKELFNNK